jgi:hypothetical protein
MNIRETCLLRAIGDVRRRPAHLLQARASDRQLDALELRDPIERAHHLDPSAVHAGLDAVQLVEAVIAVLLLPQRTRDRVECHPEAVADAVSEDLLHVRAGRAAQRRAGGEEGVVGRRAAIIVQAKDDAGEVRVARLRTTELIIGVSGRPTLRQVLHLPTATVVADDDVQLPIRTETQDSAVVITTLRLSRIGLEGAQLDEIALERQRRSIPHEAVHAIAK